MSNRAAQNQSLVVVLALVPQFALAWQADPGVSAVSSDPVPSLGSASYWETPVSIRDADHSPAAEMTARGQDAAQIRYPLGSEDSLRMSTSITSRIGKVADSQGLAKRNGYWNFRVETPLGSQLPGVALELGVGGFDWNTGRDFGEEENRMIRLRTTGKLGGFSYGLRYSDIGEGFSAFGKGTHVKGKGKEAARFWLSRSFASLSIRPFVRRSRDNGGDERTEPALTDTLVGTSLDYTWSSWPYVGSSVSYASGTRESASRAGDPGGFETGITAVSTALYLAHDRWSADVSLDRVVPGTADRGAAARPVETTYYLGGSFSPTSALSITPGFSLSDEDYARSGGSTRTMSSSLHLTYQPPRRNYLFSAFASHDSSRNREWDLDTGYLYSEAGIQWKLGGSGPVTRLLSFAIAYADYRDRSVGGADTSDLSVQLTFRSFSLSDILWGAGRQQLYSDRRRLNGIR
jgi:hypothetical protein